MAKRICSNCSSKVSKKAAFCNNCGQEMVAKVKATGVRKEAFSADTLLIGDVLANLNVTSYNGSTIQVEVSGNEEYKKKASVRLMAGAVLITAPIPKIPAQWGGQMVDDSKIINVEVKIPKGTNLVIANSYGTMVVGSGIGTLEITSGGSCKVQVADGTNAQVTMSGSAVCSLGNTQGNSMFNANGSSKILVQTVNGILGAKSNGNSKISVSNGTISTLSVNSNGDSEISVGNGTISTLRANSNGSSEISIRSQVNKGYFSANGSSTIRARNCRTVAQKSTKGSANIYAG